MKRRLRKMVNFVGTNLLIFAVYLNFFHKDKNELPNANTLIRPAFGDSDQNTEAIKAHQESSLHMNEQAALADPKHEPQQKF